MKSMMLTVSNAHNIMIINFKIAFIARVCVFTFLNPFNKQTVSHN